MCEAVSIIHTLALGGHKHSKHKPTNKKANQSKPDLRAQLMRLSHGNSTAMSPSYLDTKVKSKLLIPLLLTTFSHIRVKPAKEWPSQS